MEKVKIFEIQLSKHPEHEVKPKREVNIYFEGIEPLNEGQKECIIVEQSFLYKLLSDALKKTELENTWGLINRPDSMF